MHIQSEIYFSATSDEFIELYFVLIYSEVLSSIAFVFELVATWNRLGFSGHCSRPRDLSHRQVHLTPRDFQVLFDV